jgi:hypothetical protein
MTETGCVEISVKMLASHSHARLEARDCPRAGELAGKPRGQSRSTDPEPAGVLNSKFRRSSTLSAFEVERACACRTGTVRSDRLLFSRLVDCFAPLVSIRKILLIASTILSRSIFRLLFRFGPELSLPYSSLRLLLGVARTSRWAASTAVLTLTCPEDAAPCAPGPMPPSGTGSEEPQSARSQR